MSEGDHVVLAIDLNRHVLESDEDVSLRSLGIYEAITNRHNTSTLAPTRQRGQVSIDGIFISGSLSITSRGYLPFGSINSENRDLWIKIKISLEFGYVLHQIPPLSSRRVK